MRAYCTIVLAASRSTDSNAKSLKTHGYAVVKRGGLNFIYREKTTRGKSARERGRKDGGSGRGEENKIQEKSTGK